MFFFDNILLPVAYILCMVQKIFLHILNKYKCKIRIDHVKNLFTFQIILKKNDAVTNICGVVRTRTFYVCFAFSLFLLFITTQMFFINLKITSSASGLNSVTTCYRARGPWSPKCKFLLNWKKKWKVANITKYHLPFARLHVF